MEDTKARKRTGPKGGGKMAMVGFAGGGRFDAHIVDGIRHGPTPTLYIVWGSRDFSR